MKKDLKDTQADKLLQSCGYSCGNTNLCIVQLIKRLSENEEFPHEIGLFLGYPPEDVEGFIIHRGRDSKYTGTWKVYGNVDKAKRIFDRYRRCTKAYLEANRRGISLSRLAVHKH